MCTTFLFHFQKLLITFYLFSKLVPYFGLSLHVTTNGTMTSGLVGEMSHQVLPTVSPLATLILTFLAMMVTYISTL